MKKYESKTKHAIRMTLDREQRTMDKPGCRTIERMILCHLLSHAEDVADKMDAKDEVLSHGPCEGYPTLQVQ